MERWKEARRRWRSTLGRSGNPRMASPESYKSPRQKTVWQSALPISNLEQTSQNATQFVHVQNMATRGLGCTFQGIQEAYEFQRGTLLTDEHGKNAVALATWAWRNNLQRTRYIQTTSAKRLNCRFDNILANSVEHIDDTEVIWPQLWRRRRNNQKVSWQEAKQCV